jgi:hypothetical protein
MADMRDKRRKFVELANKRVNRAIRELRLVGNLSNTSAYEYTDEDVKKIVRTLQKEIDSMRARFMARGGESSQEFTI